MANENKQNSGGVADMPQRCPVEGCSKKIERAGFCGDHFLWFKEGLVNKKGEKPRDFDKKYQAYVRKTGRAA